MTSEQETRTLLLLIQCIQITRAIARRDTICVANLSRNFSCYLLPLQLQRLLLFLSCLNSFHVASYCTKEPTYCYLVSFCSKNVVGPPQVSGDVDIVSFCQQAITSLFTMREDLGISNAFCNLQGQDQRRYDQKQSTIHVSIREQELSECQSPDINFPLSSVAINSDVILQPVAKEILYSQEEPEGQRKRPSQMYANREQFYPASGLTIHAQALMI